MSPRPAGIVLCLASLGGCVDGPADDRLGESEAALTPVTWTSVVGATASGSVLTKTRAENAWNAGAVSAEVLERDGFVEFTTGEATTAKMAGLSRGNDGVGSRDIDFAIRLGDTGRVAVVEAGVSRGTFTDYVAGDRFRVQVKGGVVTYRVNGAVIYTSVVAPTFPLLVDTSLRTPGATLADVAIEELPFWKDIVRAIALGSDLSKTAPEIAWNAGAVSIGAIAEGDGYVEFKVADNTTLKAAGLSSGNGGESYADIDFAIYLNASGQVAVYEAGIKRDSFGDYGPADRFQVTVEGGVVSYWKDGFRFYSSAVAPTFPLGLDVALKTPGASILDARVGEGPAPTCVSLQQGLLGPGNGARFGDPIEAGGDVLVVGNQFGAPSAVAVYRRSPAGWVEEQILPGGGEGVATAIGRTDGTTIPLLRIPEDGEPGYLELYRHDGVQWGVDAVIHPCGATFSSVAVLGDVLVAGVSGLFTEPSAGYAYVYRRGPTGWDLDAVLANPNDSLYDRFGEQVAIGGDRIFVADSQSAVPALYAGGVHVFRYNAHLADPPEPPSCSAPHPGKWRWRTLLHDPDGEYRDFLGRGKMVATASGRRLLVGVDNRDRVLIFTLGGATWSSTRISAPFTAAYRFGHDVALAGSDGEVAVVSPYATFDGVFVYAEQSPGWHQVAVLEAPFEGTTGWGGTFGNSVAAVDDAIIVGQLGSDQAADDAGAVFTYRPEPTCMAE